MAATSSLSRCTAISPTISRWPKAKGHTREGGIRVPLVIRGPGIEKNSQSGVPVIGWDFFPTFKSMLDIDATLPRGVDSWTTAGLGSCAVRLVCSRVLLSSEPKRAEYRTAMKAFGDRLGQAREAKGVSIAAVAKSTRISDRYLYALERSDLEALPGGVFDKGYIKSYAQFLDIDPRPLLESYGIEELKRGRGTPEHERQKLAELRQLADARSRARRGRAALDPARFLVALLGVALMSLVAATAWLIFRGPTPASEPNPLSEDSATLTRSLSTGEPTPAAPAEEPVAAAESPATPTTLTIPQKGVGTGISERNLVGRSDCFPEGAKVWFWTRIVEGKSEDRVRHVWIHEGRTHMNAELRVGGSHWRTYSTLELPVGAAGD